jgi:hypothetical protein
LISKQLVHLCFNFFNWFRLYFWFGGLFISWVVVVFFLPPIALFGTTYFLNYWLGWVCDYWLSLRSNRLILFVVILLITIRLCDRNSSKAARFLVLCYQLVLVGMLQLCAAILEGLINDFVIWTAL